MFSPFVSEAIVRRSVSYVITPENFSNISNVKSVFSFQESEIHKEIQLSSLEKISVLKPKF